MGRAGLARKPDEKQSLWLITDKGRKYIENPPLPSATPSATLSETPPGKPPEEIIVPSQADPFKAKGKEELNRSKKQENPS